MANEPWRTNDRRGGPMATVLRAGEVELGGEVDVGQQTALVWWAAGGLTWRL